jgi:hypothetical protein
MDSRSHLNNLLSFIFVLPLFVKLGFERFNQGVGHPHKEPYACDFTFLKFLLKHGVHVWERNQFNYLPAGSDLLVSKPT